MLLRCPVFSTTTDLLHSATSTKYRIPNLRAWQWVVVACHHPWTWTQARLRMSPRLYCTTIKILDHAKPIASQKLRRAPQARIHLHLARCAFEDLFLPYVTTSRAVCPVFHRPHLQQHSSSKITEMWKTYPHLGLGVTKRRSTPMGALSIGAQCCLMPITLHKLSLHAEAPH